MRFSPYIKICKVVSSPIEVSENIFLSRVHFSIKKGDYFLKQDPYRVEQYGIKWYRETDPTKNVGFKVSFCLHSIFYYVQSC